MSRFKGPVFASWRSPREADKITQAKQRRAEAAKTARTGRVERVPGRSLPYGHQWTPHERPTGKAAQRRRRQMARAAAQQKREIAPENTKSEESTE